MLDFVVNAWRDSDCITSYGCVPNMRPANLGRSVLSNLVTGVHLQGAYSGVQLVGSDVEADMMATEDKQRLLRAREAVGSGTNRARDDGWNTRVGPHGFVIGRRARRAWGPIALGSATWQPRRSRVATGRVVTSTPSKHPRHRPTGIYTPPSRNAAPVPHFFPSPSFQGRAFSCAFLSTAVLSFLVLSVPVRLQFSHLRQAQSCSSQFLSLSFWPPSSSRSLCSVMLPLPLPQSAMRKQSHFR